MRNKNDPSLDSINGGNIRDIFGFSLFGSHKSRLLSLISSDIEKKRKIWIATVNPEFVMMARQDKKFLAILQKRTTYNVIDGVGLIWARLVESRKSKVERFIYGIKIGMEILAGRHRDNLITGADLINGLCQMAEQKKQTVCFYGGWGDRSQKTAQYFICKYPKLKIVGAKAENFDFDIKTDYLFVARGMKKQEEWIEANFDKLKVGLVMGVGRSFDYYSGHLSRAPKWIRDMGFEWLFSLMMEPKRWKRQLVLPKFIWMVLKNPPRI